MKATQSLSVSLLFPTSRAVTAHTCNSWSVVSHLVPVACLSSVPRALLTALLMPAKRKAATAKLRDSSDTKRTKEVSAEDATAPQPPSSLSPSTSSAPSHRPLSSSSNWAQLPTELLSLIAGHASLRALLHLAMVN